MVAWLHQTVPFKQVGEFVPAKIEAQLWRHVKDSPPWVWQDAVTCKLAKIRSWVLVLQLVVEAVTGWKRHGKPANGPTAPQAAKHAGDRKSVV